VTNPLPTANAGYTFTYVDFPLYAPNSTYSSVLTTDYDSTTCVYPFGMDPTWFLDSNDILTV
jgi:hypothetical protein